MAPPRKPARAGPKPKPRERPDAETVDAYLAQVEEPSRSVLAKLRARILAAAPGAEERIAYRIPTYRLNGPLIHFAAQPRHLALYGVSRDMLRAFAKELAPFDVVGTTVRFTAEKPLPAALVTRMVKARVRENLARGR